MQHFVFDLDFARENGQFGDRACLLQINPIVHRYPRLELREFDQCVARLAPNPFQFRYALACRPPWPRFQTVKNEASEERESEDDKARCERPTRPPRRCLVRRAVRWQLHQPKKVPPPTPEGREGRLFPPEHSFKSEFAISELTLPCKKIFTPWLNKSPGRLYPLCVKLGMRYDTAYRYAAPVNFLLTGEAVDLPFSYLPKCTAFSHPSR
jgi:hypothetical protein